jgi:hypothetical protein
VASGSHRHHRQANPAPPQEAPPHRHRRIHARTHVLLLIQDLHVRVINAATGELLRELDLDPDRDYQPTGPPADPKTETPQPS